jgi:hypothetical protein
MSWGSIYLLSERSLKVCCLVLGIIFLGITVYVWGQGELQANDAHPLILVPLLSAIVLLSGAAALKKEPLQKLVLLWFLGVPALFWVVNTVACGAGWFTQSWCQ